MHKIIVITGPTAVGKTKLSIELAKKYDGEIINADAVQVYKGLNIGSAKVTEEEKEGIPHHLLDFKEVTEEYTIYHYQKDCREKIKDIQSRNKTPILVGGTGLYIKAALYDYKLSEEKSTNTYDNLTNEELYEELKKLDKDIIIDICFQYISLLAGQKGLDRIKHQIDIELSKRSIEIPEKNNTKILETAILNNV